MSVKLSVNSIVVDNNSTVDIMNGKIAMILPAYDDDAAAGADGLVEGELYQTTGAGASPLDVAGIMMVKQGT